jgi:hypothetical protein
MAKMKCYEIDVNGKSFKYQEVFHNAAGKNVLIGSTSLSKELIDKDGSYKSKYAQSIDERFYGYIDDAFFSVLTFDEFEGYVNKNID